MRMQGLSPGSSGNVKRRLSPSCRWELAEGEVHLWKLDSAHFTAQEGKLMALLSEEERAKAARFLQPRDRSRSILARAALRAILGRYTGRYPRHL